MKFGKFTTVGLLLIWLLAGFFVSVSSYANPQSLNQSHSQHQSRKLNFSPLFIALSDAMGEIKNHNIKQAQADLMLIQQAVHTIGKDRHHQSLLLQEVQSALTQAKDNPSEMTLNKLSVALYAYEKEQNPVDYTAKRHAFTKQIMPALSQLNQAVEHFQSNGDIDKLKFAYDQFNKAWVINERVVRNTSMTHYGKIETAMAMMRVGLENTPPNTVMITDNMANLKMAIGSYNQTQSTDNMAKINEATKSNIDLAYGIGLLQDALSAFERDNSAIAQAKLGEFIQIWAMIEGDVRTKDAQLYGDIESQLPIIMAKGDKYHQNNLATLINRLQLINPTARYSWVDATLILLREGLEALLVVMALITALTVAKQNKGKKWVMAGVGLGLGASLVGAWVLASLFPSLTSGASREALEGVVGILSVVMMMGVGAWLHSKSSTKAWNAYIKRHMGAVLSTGNMVGLFGLAFLSVFREGAETVLFYVGILPSIHAIDFVLGIGVALAILVVVAVIMIKTSVKMPIPLLFKILTWLIYALGFKILGASISALQLTGHLPRDVVDSPAITMLGIYPSVQGLAVQAVYVAVVVLLGYVGHSYQPNQSNKR